jgi:hypothetical protein
VNYTAEAAMHGHMPIVEQPRRFGQEPPAAGESIASVNCRFVVLRALMNSSSFDSLASNAKIAQFSLKQFVP